MDYICNSALVCLVTLTFDLLTLKLVRMHSCPWDGQPSCSFLRCLAYVTFRSRLMGQQPSDAPRDIAILNFDLEGRGACRLCGSSKSICVPRLKFVGLPVRKIWHTFINRPGDFDLWLLISLIGSRVTRVMGFHSANFGLSRFSVLELGRELDTDGQTDTDHHFIMLSH